MGHSLLATGSDDGGVVQEQSHERETEHKLQM